MRRLSKRLLSLLLILAMVLPFCRGLAPFVAAANSEETVYVLAGSDFQDSSDDLSAENVSAILQNVYNAGYTSFNGFMFCGDYSNQSAWTKENSGKGLKKLKETVTGKFGTISNQYYVQGNHDPWDTEGLSQSIGYETDYYSVFVLNEDDYNWYQTVEDAEDIRDKVAELKTFLDQQEVGKKPVFVLAHVPLHYSYRTNTQGDATYAKYIVDVLNEAGQRGLNIIFMYGHNHGGGLDNYLGGSTNYIPKGDTLYIAAPFANYENAEIPAVARTINFTYMNAGMVGYYGATDQDGNGYHVDGALTMSVFAITGDDVVVRRFCGGTTKDSVTKEAYCTCADGKHMVKKSAGEFYNEEEEARYGYKLNTKTFVSPQTISGTNVEIDAPFALADNTFTVGSSAVVSAPAENGVTYAWETSDSLVATVSAMDDNRALITGQSEGTAMITVTKTSNARTTESTSFYVEVSEGEGLVVENSGKWIFRRAQSLRTGRRYMIADWSDASWNVDDVYTIRATSNYSLGYEMATVYKYADGVPFITEESIAQHYGNVWRFQSSGNGDPDEGYLIAERTDYSKRYYIHFAPDGGTQWLSGAISGDGVYSVEWTWTNGCLLNTKPMDGEMYWLGFQDKTDDWWPAVADSAWKGSGCRSTYIYEYTENVATATLSDKKAYVAVGATVLPTMLVKTWTTGKVEYIPLTLDMFTDENDNQISTATPGIYTNLTVTYNGVIICEDYTLCVGTEVTGSVTQNQYYYRLVDTFENGKEYVIVSRNTAGVGYVLTSNGYNASTTATQVTIQLDADGVPAIRSNVSVPSTAVWKYVVYGGYSYTWLEQSGYSKTAYLCFNVNNPDGVNVGAAGSGAMLYAGEWYEAWSLKNPGAYTGSGTNYPYLKGWSSLRAFYGNNGSNYAYLTFNKHYKQFLSVGNDNRKWGEEVYIYEKVAITDVTYEALGTTGKVNVGASATTLVGTAVELRYPDGSVEMVSVTADMLYYGNERIKDDDLTSPIRMTGLTLKYNNQVLTTNFTLEVLSETQNDYPEFPSPGAVRVDKHLGKSDFIFNQTGVAKVDLTVTGTPKQNPMDVLVIMDTSSSVVTNYMADGQSRLEVMREALGDLIDILQAPNPDGTLPDVCLAISEFNDYTYFKDYHSLNGLPSKNDISGDVFNGQIIGFTNVHTMDNFDVSKIEGHGGTNYDVAFQDAYDILDKRKQEYSEIGQRDQIVVFMTDGICFQYNYMSFEQGAVDSPVWEKWMIGGLTDADLNAYLPAGCPSVFNELYAGYGYSGKHWMAEVIKANPFSEEGTPMLHPVIWNESRHSNVAFDGFVNYQSRQGLGATIYSVGFGLDVDGEYNAMVGKQVLANIASDPELYYDANDRKDLRRAFSDIGRSVRKAATNAYMMDQMGEFFDLQMGQVEDSSHNTFAAPSITIKTYDLFKNSEVGTIVNGVLVTEEMVGTHKSESPAAVLETISFSADGTVVTSSAKTDANILVDGVINGKYFYYNTSKTTTKNIVVNGKTVSLAPETIYWYIGDIIEQE